MRTCAQQIFILVFLSLFLEPGPVLGAETPHPGAESSRGAVWVWAVPGRAPRLRKARTPGGGTSLGAGGGRQGWGGGGSEQDEGNHGRCKGPGLWSSQKL